MAAATTSNSATQQSNPVTGLPISTAAGAAATLPGAGAIQPSNITSNASVQNSLAAAGQSVTTGATGSQGANTSNSGNTTGNTGATGDQVTAPTINGQSVIDTMNNLVNNPSLPAGSAMVAANEQVQPNELINDPNTLVSGDLSQNAAQSQAGLVNPNTVTNVAQVGTPTETNAANYSAQNVNNIPQATAATMATDPQALTSTQFQELTANGTPAWAAQPIGAAEATMAGRGLGNSSMAENAITSAAINATLPVAQANASTVQAFDLANLTNEQQTAMANLQVNNTDLLSNQSAQNAALQFNANSQQQLDEFFQTLTTGIATTNANSVNAMSQFNTAQTNAAAATNANNETAVNEANAAAANAMSQFNANLANQRQTFNANNQLTIDQSNATWQRTVNTANTVAQNAANQINAQNAFNLSDQALTNVWQEYRDEASWANQNQQNDETRAQQLAMISLQQTGAINLQDNAATQQFYQSLGSFATTLLGGALTASANS